MLRFLSFLLIINVVFAGPRLEFDDYFYNKTMRIDYYQTGDHENTIISLDEVKEEPIWAGSLTNLIDDMNLGDHIVKVYDLKSDKLIFTKSFNSIFSEYQSTNDAINGIFKTYSNTMLIPYPKEKIRFTISSRDESNNFKEEFSTIIDPTSRFINHDSNRYKYDLKSLLKNGNPNEKVDILVLPEGYTKKEMKYFIKDMKKMFAVFFDSPPLKEAKDKFNVWYLETPSKESGIDDPRKGIFVNTVYDLTFNTLDIDRYVQGFNNKVTHDIAANAPYDQIYFIMNTGKYGGGGIFNYCAISYSPSKNKNPDWWPGYVFVHEFGHSFAGLADEYYSSEVAFNDLYPQGVEPWESNITTLTNPENVKWKHLIDEDIEIPTYWDQDKYDKIPRRNWEERYNYLRRQSGWGKIGVFEGAGYARKGVYRSYLDCRMFSKSMTPFCPVCQDAVKKMIQFYAE